jgi:hypothetical protein
MAPLEMIAFGGMEDGSISSRWPAEALRAAGRPVRYIGRGEYEQAPYSKIIVSGVRTPEQVARFRRFFPEVWILECDDVLGLPLPLIFALAQAGRWSDQTEDEHRAAYAAADGVIVTTDVIAERIAPYAKEIRVARQYLPAWLTKIEPDPPTQGPPIISWYGYPNVHGIDLEWIAPELRKLIADTDARFHTVGDEDTPRLLGLDLERCEAVGPSPPGALYWHLARTSIGIVPLADHPFNDAKSPTKGSEFAALGVPFVAADRQPYRDMAERMPIRLAATPKDMCAQVRELIEDPELRARESEALRVAARSMTLEANIGEWERAVLS